MDGLQENILKAIEIIVDEKLKNLSFNTKIDGVIVEVLGEDKYKIAIDDNIIAVKGFGQEYKVGDSVIVVYFNNQKHTIEERRIIGLK